MEDNFEGVKVMVIDDSKTIRRTAETLLSKAGCEVITATDGFDSLASMPQAQDTGKADGEAAAPAQGSATASAEMIRVSADLVENLISLAGESSITRGRVEQQISDIGESLQDMEQTINRIKDQVHQLEIEAESRETLQTTRADSSFDELEMDRYTMLQEVSRVLNEATSDMSDLKDTLISTIDEVIEKARTAKQQQD